MKLFAIKNETTLLTENEFQQRVSDWRNTNINKLAMVRNTLSLIEQCYLDEGECYESVNTVCGKVFGFTATVDYAPKANATAWPHQISRDADRIVIAAENEENAKETLSKIFAQHYAEIDREISAWYSRMPRYQQFEFNESKIRAAEPEPFSSLEALEDAVNNR